jgi:hypothetical protein
MLTGRGFAPAPLGWMGGCCGGNRCGRRSQCDSGRIRAGGGVSSGEEGWGLRAARRPGEASASSHSPGCDTATCKSGDEMSHSASPSWVSCCDDPADKGAPGDPQAESAAGRRSVTDVAVATHRRGRSNKLPRLVSFCRFRYQRRTFGTPSEWPTGIR